MGETSDFEAGEFTEDPLVFACAGESLIGILSRPLVPSTRAVLIVVGGPQYRVGSHRQFALLARYLAERGVAVLRFDYRGMGDSSGPIRTFEDINDDIRSAIDLIFNVVPEVKDAVIWGLCDAASAAAFYAYRDSRVSGLVLANPWVRTTEGEAKAHLRHYYLDRLRSPELWKKLCNGELHVLASVKSLASNVLLALRGRAGVGSDYLSDTKTQELPARMGDALERFTGRILIMLSGNDLTASEFVDVSDSSKQWRGLMSSPRLTSHRLPDATHTFSRREWRDQVAARTVSWLRSW